MTRIALALAVLVLVACGGADPTGGVRGTVQAGPTCPVEIEASPCPPTPWTGTVRATSADGEEFDVQTDANGAYTLALPPGDYVVVALTGEGGPPMGVPADVTVGETFVTLDLSVDTGIR